MPLSEIDKLIKKCVNWHKKCIWSRFRKVCSFSAVNVLVMANLSFMSKWYLKCLEGFYICFYVCFIMRLFMTNAEIEFQLSYTVGHIKLWNRKTNIRLKLLLYKSQSSWHTAIVQCTVYTDSFYLVLDLCSSCWCSWNYICAI